MAESRKVAIAVFILIAAVTVATDQFTKHLVVTGIPFNHSLEVIPGLVNLVHARNPGAAFGILAGSEWQFRSLFFIAVSVAALVLIIVFIVFSEEMDGYLLVGYSLFFAGALGNLADRIRFGDVTDFLDVYWRGLHWPAFNVADSALCAGAFFIFLHFLRARKSGSVQPE